MNNMKKYINSKAPTLLTFGLFAVVSLFVLSTSGQTTPDAEELFTTSEDCQSCHNNLGTENGEDLSIGISWKSSMMAHSAVDPYWLAGVRREITDHPGAAEAIQDECSKCHKPMQRFADHANGLKGLVFKDPAAESETESAATSDLAMDGVSCAMCHQIKGDNLGSEESFVGGFKVDTAAMEDERKIYGPFDVTTATKRVMRSATSFEPGKADHIQSSEFCATCHTLFTHSLDAEGNDLGKFPEQVPYLEWLHSVYSEGGTSCQDCHMATSNRDNPISSVLGKPREHFSKHSFRGGNFLLPQLMGQNAEEVGARATAQEFDVGIRNTRAHLESKTAKVKIDKTRSSIADGKLRAVVTISNLAGHKLPTAYPSRRTWIQFIVRGPSGNLVFESGALKENGAIDQNDNDLDSSKYEPHYTEVTSPKQVQIYEAIMGKPDGTVTTGLLEATQYLKDNRLLPEGFDKTTAEPDVSTRGAALKDESFVGGSHSTTYAIPITDASGPYTITARLWYQPIGHRWAINLADYDAAEPKDFVEMYESIPGKDTATMLAEDGVTLKEILPISYPDPLPAEVIPKPN